MTAARPLALTLKQAADLTPWSVQTLRSKSWARMVNMPMQAADQQQRVQTVVDVRTFLMLLASINENKVSEAARPLLIAYQAEVADVIEAYWTKGGAVNPRATGDQLDVLARQMDVLRLAQGLCDSRWLESKARMVAARALGEAPDVAPQDVPLYVEDYLRHRGMSRQEVVGNRSAFGRRLARAFFDAHGRKPDKAPGDVGSRIREINSYTESDRPLFDQVWSGHYADAFGTEAVAS